jgi:hypothetical protein
MATDNTPTNVTIAYSDKDVARRLYLVEKRLIALETVILEHLRTSRQACLQQVGFLEQSLGMNPTTAELRRQLDKG